MGRHRRTSKRGRTAAEANALEGGIGGGALRELAAISHDPERWPSLDEDTLLLIVFQQCLYFAHTQDPEAAGALGMLYPHLVSRVGEAERLELQDRVATAVEEGGASVLALLPFLQHEPSSRAVALAAVSFASLMPLTDGDEMTGPRTLVRMAEHADDESTCVGLLGGLLQLGDARVTPLLRPVWQQLSAEARVSLSELRAPSQLLFASTVEFWLEALEAADDPTFEAIAAALARLPEEAEPARVLDVVRKFPANVADDRDEISIVADRTILEQGARMAERLHALARRDGAPGRLRDLMRVWGVAPAA